MNLNKILCIKANVFKLFFIIIISIIVTIFKTQNEHISAILQILTDNCYNNLVDQ